MLLLPSHYDQYEPLNKKASLFLSKVRQRRVALLVLLLIASLGGYRLYRVGLLSSSSSLEGNAASRVGAILSSPPSASSFSSPSTSTVAVWDGIGWIGDTHTVKVDVAAASLTSSPAFATATSQPSQPPSPSSISHGALQTDSASSPSSSSSSSTTTTTEETRLIDEADWHMPSDVSITVKHPLMRSRFKAFFRQASDDIHREKGFGTPVDLREAPFIRRSLYRHLLQSFNSFAEAHDFHYWLAHGSLLGQRWGQKIMSGDTDVDLQTSLGALHRMRPYENLLWEDRFELVINPHYLIRKTRNYQSLGLDRNVIDARWIDILTGHYIDITALSGIQADQPWFDIAPFTGEKQVTIIQDKSPHRYSVSSINPTRRCQFEGMKMWCPNKIEEALEPEYKNYNLPHFQTWRFNQTIQAFNEVTCLQLVNMYRYPNEENCDEECRYVVSHERHLKWNYLVMRGDGGLTTKGCLLTITWNDEAEQKQVSREYWGRDVPGQVLAFKNARNITYPAVVI